MASLIRQKNFLFGCVGNSAFPSSEMQVRTAFLKTGIGPIWPIF